MLKFRNNVTFRREYLRAFTDAVNGPMSPATVNARIDLIHNALLAQGVTASGTQVVKDYVAARRNYIVTQLNAVAAPFSVSGPTTLTTSNSTLAISGTASVGTKKITLNGVDLAVTWSSVTNWSATYLLAPGTNTLLIAARDSSGAVTDSTTLTATYTGTAVWPELRINEWLASNMSYLDPVDLHADDWLEIYNPTGGTVNLTNWRLSDTLTNPAKYIIPSGYSIPPGGRLLVWADNEVVQNTATNPQLHAPFKLSASGGAILLSAPDGTRIDQVSFGPQVSDRSEGRYPDGAAAKVTLTLPTPDAANSLTLFSEFTRAGTTVTMTFSTTAGFHYLTEFSEDLINWYPLGNEQIAAASSLSLMDGDASSPRRFYRVRIGD